MFTYTPKKWKQSQLKWNPNTNNTLWPVFKELHRSMHPGANSSLGRRRPVLDARKFHSCRHHQLAYSTGTKLPILNYKHCRNGTWQVNSSILTISSALNIQNALFCEQSLFLSYILKSCSSFYTDSSLPVGHTRLAISYLQDTYQHNLHSNLKPLH